MVRRNETAHRGIEQLLKKIVGEGVDFRRDLTRDFH
jgi:hypothetical protein